VRALAANSLWKTYVLRHYDSDDFHGANGLPTLLAPLVEVAMAIQDYVRSIAAEEKVSKAEVFRFLEMQFSRADRNHDGSLDLEELSVFVNAIVRPDADQR
jgi:hypothetical protein